MREGRARRGFRGGRGLYRSDGGSFSGVGGPGNFETYSDMEMFGGPAIGYSSMDSSFCTSVESSVKPEKWSSSYAVWFAAWSGGLWPISSRDHEELLD